MGFTKAAASTFFLATTFGLATCVYVADEATDNKYDFKGKALDYAGGTAANMVDIGKRIAEDSTTALVGDESIDAAKDLFSEYTGYEQDGPRIRTVNGVRMDEIGCIYDDEDRIVNIECLDAPSFADASSSQGDPQP